MAQKYIPVALRRHVRARAAERCEYCTLPERFSLKGLWVDHIVAEKHGGKTEEGNLALSCAVCNQHKGTDLASIDPDTGAIRPLFHPRNDAWGDHFRFNGAIIEPLTTVGRVTVRLLQFNATLRVLARREWIGFGTEQGSNGVVGS